MLLTKLEVKGFKSFGDKITINFDEGVTGIVGQNGCGKSNVIDAIRWVLGEQSTKALRSDKMENVIFNGTKKRKPLNMAEVSLTFKNTKNLLATEYSEVTISRRLYRSGDSEYLLNNVPCRLKDITNLFLDTGIGSDSYAIIELKMVDEILNDKDNSRRNLFEEAAGISKFKVRKKETLKKLHDADQDLARVEDLLFEIDKNLKSLEKQAKKTEKYYKTREEYKASSIAFAQKSVSERREVFTSLAQKIDEEQDKKISLQKRIAEKDAFIEKEKTDLLQKEKTLASRQKTLNDLVNKIRQYESEKKIKNERLKFLEDKQANLLEQIELDQQRHEEDKTEIEKLEAERHSAFKILQEAKAELEELKAEYEAQKEKSSAVQEQAAGLNSRFSLRQQEAFHLNKSLEVKQSQISGLKQELEKFAVENFERNDSLRAYKKNLQELEEKRNEAKEEMEQLQAEENDLQHRIEDLQEEIENAKTRINDLNRQLDAKQNEYQLTKSLVDNLEGFPDAIKFLKSQSEWQQIPLLSDILSCEEAYRAAIEQYLEPYMNYYVVQNAQEALWAIALLQDAQKGKANFFVLSQYQNPKSKVSATLVQAKAALDLVQYEPSYAPLVEALLGELYIIEEAEIDAALAAKGTFITRNGRLLKRQGSLSGGSVGAFEGKRIGRAKNLELLSKDIESLQAQVQEAQNALAHYQADLQELRLNTRKEEMREAQSAYTRLQESYISVRTKSEQLQNLLDNSLSQREHLEARLESLSQELETLTPESARLQEEVADLQEQIEGLQDTLLYENEALSQKSGAYNHQNIRYHQQENRLASIEQEIKFKTDAWDALTLRIARNQEELSKTKQAVEELSQTADLNDDELVAMYEEKDAVEKALNEAEKEYYAARGDIDQAEKETRELQRQKEMGDALIQELNNKINETKLSLSAVKERLSVEFSVDLEQLMEEEYVESPLSLEALQAQVQSLKSTIDNIGPINPMATEAYNEMKQRFDFINTQKEDLLAAKNSLLETIQEIDQVAKENFLKTYDQIRINFQQVFRSLFTEEDTCDLILVNPDNPLESPIDIIAKPKGKRPLTINQLSGGEKTLTATSLLFAIYLIKPAPFCIFDEVDAPLDDANVDKFTNIIRTFSKESQFIIVTHNKRTMLATDIMYGVTMFPEDPGVSKLVPVDMRGLVEAE
jgi:chromosome segregation protein